MNEIQQFVSEKFGGLRVATRNGEPWFVAADVCKALELSDTGKAIDRLDGDESTRIEIAHPQSPGKTLEVIAVNEPGLYALVLGSRKKEAKAFKRWVTHDVIPAIRKHGAYMTDDTLKRALTEPEFLRDLADRLIEEKNKRLGLEVERAALLPKAEYYDLYMESPDLITTTTIAQNYGMEAAHFNKMLESMGIQYRSGRVWVLKKQYLDKGYMQSATYRDKDNNRETHNWNKWTPKGQKFLYDFLKERNIIPIAERQKRRWMTNVI